MATARRLAAALALTLAAGACGGGGEGAVGGADDPLAEVGTAAGERMVQVRGAGDVRIGGSLAVPAAAARARSPGVLIVPGGGLTDRNGVLSAPPDPLYQDLSRSLGAAGMVTLRYDRRGSGASKLAPDGRLSFDDLVTDARQALSFLAQRTEVSGPVAVVGHDIGGIVALRLAATDPRVRAVVLVSTPGRPLADVDADELAATYGPASADAFRQVVAGLLASGSLPGRAAIRPEHQPYLLPGDEAYLATVFSLDPPAEARPVRVPSLVVVGGRSVGVTAADASRLVAALGATAEVLAVADAGPTLQQSVAPPTADPSDPDSAAHEHGASAQAVVGPRQAGALDRLSAFLATHLGASPG